MFGSRKKVPDYNEKELFAYLRRIEPKVINGKRVDGKVSGEFEGFHSTDELEQMVSDVCGGGEYSAKLHEAEDKSKYIGSHRFRVSGAVKQDGTVVEEKKSRKTEKQTEVEKEIADIKAKSALYEAKVEADKHKQDLFHKSDDDNELSPQISGLQTMINEQKEEMDRLRKEMLEREEKRHEDDKFKELRDSIESLKNNSGGSDTAAVQMEAIKSVINSGQEQMRVMLSAIDSNRKETTERMSEILKLMLTKSDSSGDAIAASQARMDSLMDKLLDAKTASSDQTLATMRDAWKAGLSMGQGKSPEDSGPTTAVDVAMVFTEKLSSVLGDYMKLKNNDSSSEAIKKEIGPAVQRVIQQLGPTMANPPVKTQAATPGGSGTDKASVRKTMDKVLAAFIQKARGNEITEEWITNQWMSLAIELLPAEIVARITNCMRTSNVNGLFSIIDEYGSPDLAGEVKRLLTEIISSGVAKAETSIKETKEQTHTPDPPPPDWQGKAEKPGTVKPKAKAKKKEPVVAKSE